MANRPLILVVNDDGIESPGIRKLISIMNDFGDVIVVAPDSPKSGMSHAITLDSIIRCKKLPRNDNLQIEYSCTGTPVDCVKLALNKILNKKPDLCVSGINHGSNSSINTIYSGTIAAAIEASIEGIPSIGFSLLDHSIDANFEESDYFIRKIIKKILNNKIQRNLCLNINIPKSIPNKKIMGIKICKQANSKWIEEFEERYDSRGEKYYWLTGKFICNDDRINTDEYALTNHYISVVPVNTDFTDINLMSKLTSFFSE
tara:strand:- start:14006 stop:14782 length:777 start_codon:yes stop_codon:yes gene_type:complete